MLHVEKLAKSFEGFKAVSDANLHVPQGQIVAVIGPNGAGKSTLFNLITGHLKPNAGKVVFKGKEITGLTPHVICQRGISRSFQLINIFPQLTVFENVKVAVLARYHKTGKMFVPAKKLVNQETWLIIERLGLTQKAERVSNSLSYGDQKVLEMAISLGSQPEMLLLDEPTAGMSPEETRTIVQLVKSLALNDGLSILLTEHDMDLVFDVAQRIMVLHQGKTIAEGLPDEVKNDKGVQKAYLGETG